MGTSNSNSINSKENRYSKSASDDILNYMRIEAFNDLKNIIRYI